MPDSWASAQTADQLRESARDYFGNCDDGSLAPDDADWYYDPAFPVSLLPVPPLGWQSWWQDEVQTSKSHPALLHRLKFEHDTITEAIHISVDGTHVQIWDGWHRAGGSIVSGRTTIPAIVGIRKLVDM